jgi:dienelactone hydrolase
LKIKKNIIYPTVLFIIFGTTVWLFFNRNKCCEMNSEKYQSHYFIPIIPAPTGKFRVGSTMFHVIDKTRPELHSENISYRELILHILYPAQTSNHSAKLYAESSILSTIKEDLSKMTNIPIDQFNYLNSFKSHSFENVTIASDQSLYPIVIFSPGWGAPTNLYSALLEDLASHGYIVVGINYPYVTNPVVFPNGKIIRGIKQSQDPLEKKNMSKKEMETWIQDIDFVINELLKMNLITSSKNIFTNKLNIKKIGIFGHSFGGSVAVEACRNNKKCIAGVDIDGKLYSDEPLKKPFMFITASHAQEILQPMKDLSGASNDSKYVELEGSNHGSFTDLYLIAPFRKDTLPALDVTQGIQIIRKLLLDFFNKYCGYK